LIEIPQGDLHPLKIINGVRAIFILGNEGKPVKGSDLFPGLVHAKSLAQYNALNAQCSTMRQKLGDFGRVSSSYQTGNFYWYPGFPQNN